MPWALGTEQWAPFAERMTLGEALWIVVMLFGWACAFAACATVALLALWVMLRDWCRDRHSPQRTQRAQ